MFLLLFFVVVVVFEHQYYVYIGLLVPGSIWIYKPRIVKKLVTITEVVNGGIEIQVHL